MLSFDIERLLPAFLIHDRNGYAMAKAIEAGLKYLCERTSYGTDIIGNIADMPEWRLDEYAWEMGAVWYDSTASVDEKREQAHMLDEVYRKIGTKKALLDAVSSLFGSGSIVDEWFDYGGEPYHYKIRVTNDEATTSRREECVRLINIVTGVRCVLDSLQYYGSSGTTETIYTATRPFGAYTLVNAKNIYAYDENTSAEIGKSVLGEMWLGRL